MAGVAYLRVQETATAPVAAVPGSSAVVAAVPHGAIAAIDSTVVPVVAAVTAVPRGAVAAVDSTVVPVVTGAPVVTALPHGAVAAVDSEVAPVIVAVPHGAIGVAS